ncbi:ADP-ribosylation [Favolaschia claudopus]|uniref:ADP-ribosylation n=1 Tax=Favolaschia claudopus TaxID=2862362 RepID=A0AAW0CJ35_9AGAR
MASVIWIDSDIDDDDDFIEIIEASPRKPLAGPSTIVNTPRRPKADKKRYRAESPDSDIDIVEATPKPKVPRSVPQDHDDHAMAMALQKKWEDEDAIAQKQAAKIEERSLKLVARLQEMDQKMAEKRRQLAGSQDVPDDGIVFRVVVDADGKTIEGDDDPDNAERLEVVKKDFEQAIAGGLKVKTVQWFVNAKLEARFEAAKAQLVSLGIDATEMNLFHGTAEANIQPILENGFLIPGVSPGVQMVNGAACGIGIYLATSPSTSLSYTQGASRMFMCRVIPGRTSPKISQAVPAPLGQNGHESWTMNAGVYVVKYADLVVPRYVVEFQNSYNAHAYRLPVVAPPIVAPLGGLGVIGGMAAGPAVPFNYAQWAAMFMAAAPALPAVAAPAPKRTRATAAKPRATRAVKGKGKAKVKQEDHDGQYY